MGDSEYYAAQLNPVFKRDGSRRRVGTAAQFARGNPVLDAGEDSYETDTHVEKVGDGVTAYNSLASQVQTSTLLTRTAVKTGAYAAAVGDMVPVDTTSGAVTVTLPTAPASGSRVGVKHVVQGGSNSVTIACGGSAVLNKTGGSTSITLPLLNQSMVLQYSSGIWTIESGDLPYGSLQTAFGGIYAPIVSRAVLPPTGVTATDCANFTTALQALPATGGEVVLYPQIGGIAYDFTNGVTIDRPCTLRGSGGSDSNFSTAATLVVSTSATGNCITVNSHAVTLRGFAVVYTGGSAPTAGHGIYNTGKDGAHYEDLTVRGFYVGLEHAGGNNSWIRDCTLHQNIASEAIWNCGDSSITGNEFRRVAPGTGPNLKITQTQGLRIGDNKFLARDGGTLNDGSYCIEIAPNDGHLILDVLIHDNSIEGHNNTAVLVHTPAGGSTGQVQRLQIENNQIGSDHANYSIEINNGTASPNNFNQIFIGGNQFAGATKDISVINCDVVVIAPNVSTNGQQSPTLTSSTNVALSIPTPASFAGAWWPELPITNSVAVGARSDVFKIILPFPCTATGMAVWVAALGAQGNMDVGLYNAAGTLVASAGNPSYTTLTAAAVNLINFTTPVALLPGVYWIGACSNYSGNTYGVDSGTYRVIARQALGGPVGPMPGTLTGYNAITYAGRAGVALILQ